jgi:hypothetical protein
MVKAAAAMGDFGVEAKKAWDKHGKGVKEAGVEFGKATKANAQQFDELINQQGKFAFLAELGKNKVADAANEAKKLRFEMGVGAGAAGILAGNIANAKWMINGMNANLVQLKLDLDNANAGAAALAGFMGDAAGFAAKILNQVGLTIKERKRLEKMEKAALAAQQKAHDLTKEGFNALVKRKLAIEALAKAWLMEEAPMKWKNANLERQNELILGAITHVPALRDAYGEVSDRIGEAAAGLGDAVVLGQLAAANAELNRDHHGELLNHVWGIAGAQAKIVEQQILLKEMEIATLVAGEGLDEAKAKLAELQILQAELNAEANKHPMIEPGLVNPDAADFRVFKDSKTLLGQIDEKLGGLFVNQ